MSVSRVKPDEAFAPSASVSTLGFRALSVRWQNVRDDVNTPSCRAKRREVASIPSDMREAELRPQKRSPSYAPRSKKTLLASLRADVQRDVAQLQASIERTKADLLNWIVPLSSARLPPWRPSSSCCKPIAVCRTDCAQVDGASREMAPQASPSRPSPPCALLIGGS